MYVSAWADLSQHVSLSWDRAADFGMIYISQLAEEVRVDMVGVEGVHWVEVVVQLVEVAEMDGLTVTFLISNITLIRAKCRIIFHNLFCL